MYIGILEIPQLDDSRAVPFDLNVPGWSVRLRELMSKFGIQFDVLEKALAYALENVKDHGSQNCYVEFGVDEGGTLHVIVEDSEGGFDPRRITTPTNQGYGYEAYRSSAARVAHSSDGKITYLVSR